MILCLSVCYPRCRCVKFISNLKSWIKGTHHGVGSKLLASYLNEYIFQFNRWFYPMRCSESEHGSPALPTLGSTRVDGSTLASLTEPIGQQPDRHG
ncbi:MAG: transposase [Planctomycetes bacterium]|nr:transposase [Planctomycetota bacterium]